MTLWENKADDRVLLAGKEKGKKEKGGRQTDLTIYGQETIEPTADNTSLLIVNHCLAWQNASHMKSSDGSDTCYEASD